MEGWCFAGKTTLLDALARTASVTALPEYADIADLPPFPPHGPADVAAALNHFLGLERRRTTKIRTARTPLLACDRSPLSLIAYEQGTAALGLPADPGGAARLFAKAANNGDTVAADAYIHLHIHPDVARARQRHRGPIRPHLMHPVLRAAVDDVYTRYLDQVAPDRRLHLDGTQPAPVLARRARRFLADLPQVVAASPPPPSWLCLHPDNTDDPRQ